MGEASWPISLFARSWLARHSKRVAPSTANRYVTTIGHLVKTFGELWVADVDVPSIEAWQEEALERVAPSTANGWLRVLRLVLKAARREGLIPLNPARDVPTVREGRTGGARGRALTPHELRRLFAALDELAGREIPEDVARHVHVLAWTGMRLGESIALRFSDVVDGELRIERSVWGGVEKGVKTDDPRRVSVPEPLARVLEAQRTWLARTEHPGRESGLVFPARPQQVLAGRSRRDADASRWHTAQSTVRRALDVAVQRAGLPRVTPHALRRTFESTLAEAQIEPKVRRALAGWRTEKAQAIYSTVTRAERDVAAARFREIVEGGSTQAERPTSRVEGANVIVRLFDREGRVLTEVSAHTDATGARSVAVDRA